MRLVDRVGIMLCFQTKPAVPAISYTADAFQRAIEMIPGVKLHARLVSIGFQQSATSWFTHTSRQPERFAASIDDKVMIVPFGERVELFDVLANRFWPCEIKSSAFHG